MVIFGIRRAIDDCQTFDDLDRILIIKEILFLFLEDFGEGFQLGNSHRSLQIIEAVIITDSIVDIVNADSMNDKNEQELKE